MAGSYNHVITDQGNLVSNETFVKMIENLGDAYEAVEEMYGMIWWLAYRLETYDEKLSASGLVQEAQDEYERGLRLARDTQGKGKRDGG
jgi:hypothetical protein